MNVSIGIDIGTTSICGIAVNTAKGDILKSKTLSNNSFIASDKSYEKAQNPEKILDTALGLLEELIKESDGVKSIGITGQMHGILYTDALGNAVSPLYTWQDERGNLSLEDMTYAEKFSKLTGYKAATGYGLVTHFYNLKSGLVPECATKLCTIHDFLAMKLAGLKTPVTHISDAASLGCYSFKDKSFDLNALKKAEIDVSVLPKVVSDFEILGHYKGIPVSVAIGDNQASFLGAVGDDNTLLINVGTGSQVSLVAKTDTPPENTELRPLYGDKCILVGSSLCGGRAYAALKDFFLSVGRDIFGIKAEKIYDAMDKLTEKECDFEPLKVSTLFCGTRNNPKQRGSITNLGLDNFTLAALVSGTLLGMTEELFEMFSLMKEFSVCPITELVGSGNGIRCNLPLQSTVKESFNMELKIPKNCEEAAFGSVLFSLVGIGEFESPSAAATALIKYN